MHKFGFLTTNIVYALTHLLQRYRPPQRQSSFHSDVSLVVREAHHPQQRQLIVDSDILSDVTTPSSRLTLLSRSLDSTTPSLRRFYPIITQAGLCTDEHLNQFFCMSSTWREKFLSDAFADSKPTLFERSVVTEILEQMRNEKS